MFRNSAVARVQAAFAAAIPAPYEAEIKLEDDRNTMRVVVTDPDDPALPIAQVIWQWDIKGPTRLQPSDEEIAVIANSFALICADYPAQKAAEAGA